MLETENDLDGRFSNKKRSTELRLMIIIRKQPLSALVSAKLNSHWLR